MLHVELLPDEAGETRLREDWARLEQAGLPNLSRHRSASNRPHVTVSMVADELAPDGDWPLHELARATAGLPLPLRVGALALFGSGPWVLVRTLVVTEPLLALHDAVTAVLGPSAVPHCRPGRWVPHTTLAHGLDAAQVARALPLLSAPDDGTEPVGILDRARCWDSARRQVLDPGDPLRSRSADG